MTRPPRIVHATSEPLVFFGRGEVLSLLDGALGGAAPSVVGLVGPGGEGKTAIAQHWLHRISAPLDGVFLWSFYRGKDADLCLREWLAYAEGGPASSVSASYCAQRLLEVLTSAGRSCSTGPRWRSTRAGSGTVASTTPTSPGCWRNWRRSGCPASSS
jgi:hypothetical protein